MNANLKNDLATQETQLQNEILSVQDEIEILLVLLDRKQKELDEFRQQISDINLTDNVAA